MTARRRFSVGASATVLALGLLGVVPGTVEATGSVMSQGDKIHRADIARSVFGVSGSGRKVGVMSSGITGLDQAKNPATCRPGPVALRSAESPPSIPLCVGLSATPPTATEMPKARR